MNEEKWIAWEMQTAKRWTDMDDVLKYTNIDFIDLDHKTLAEYALKLNEAISKSENEFCLALIEEIKALLVDLYLYTQEHFAREEAFMDLYNLPNKDMHKKEHKKVLLMLSETIENIAKGKIKSINKLKTQIMDWLIKHINNTDYSFFEISNWGTNIINASDWNSIKPIIGLIGINEIDDQHQKLTSIMMKSMKNIADYPSDEVVEEECNNIIAYAEIHFNYETQFMEKYSIQESEQHIQIHDHFIQKIKYFSQEIKKEAKRIEEMKVWILTWWIKHINYLDKEYFKYENWAYKIIEKAEKLEDAKDVLRLTGLTEIDNDHIMMMSLTLDLNNLIRDNNDLMKDDGIKEQIIIYLEKINSFAVAHFEREETIMEAHIIDDLRGHRTEHRKILNKIGKIKENYIAGRLYPSANIKAMILEWWILHTNTTDYRTFLQNYDRKEKGQNTLDS